METIFTIDARDNCLLEFTSDYFKLDHNIMHREINNMFKETVDILKNKSINYQELRNCLTPSTEKQEIILVFDSIQIDSSWYGGEIFERIIPLFDRRSTHSVLSGDYLDHKLEQDRLYSELVSSINLKNPCEYRNSSQFYFVYINNVSQKMLNDLDTGLTSYKPYVGYIDVTFSSFMKHHASLSLVNSFIKHKSIVINEHEDDRENSENINMSGYAFEKNNYKCVSLQSSLFGVFLSYKIERPIFGAFKRDTDFSLNAISKNILNIDEFNVEIDEKKLTYLRENKTGRMKKSGLINFNKSEIECLIRDKIASNYIYNLTYLKQYRTMKFNILIEKELDSDERMRMMVALEYIPAKKTLRLITMV